MPSPSNLGWTRSQLGDVGNWMSGGTPSKSRSDYWGGEVPWVSPKDMKVFSLRDTLDHISHRALADGARHVPAESIFIVVRGMILAHTFPVCLAARQMAFNQDVKAIVPHASVNGRFLAHWLNGHSDALLRLVTEATHGTKRIDLRDLRQCSIDLPPLGEQRKIAKILDTVDETIRKTEAIIAKLEQVKQGLLHDLLTRGIDDNGELRDPDRHPKQFKDSPLGLIPKSWDVAPLRDYATPSRPYLKTGPFGSSLKQEHWVEDGVPVVTIGSLGEGHFTPSELLCVSETTARSLAAYALRPGDIVFSRVADVGRSVVVGAEQDGWIMSSNMMWISLDPTRAIPDFVQANIAGNQSVRSQIGRFVNAGGRDVANATIMNQLLFPWPSADEQRRISAAVQTCAVRAEREQEELAKLVILKQGLMEDLLTGRVRVTGLLKEDSAG